MSDADAFGSSPAEVITAFTAITHAWWLQIGVISLLAYEYAITFGLEVGLFWRRKITGATVLYLAIRYLALFNYAFLGALTFASISTQYSVSLCQYPFWAAFSSLRTLALSGMNWPLATAVFGLGLVPFAVNVWPMSLQEITGTTLPILGCGASEAITLRQSVIGVSLSRGSLILSDTLAVIVTWRTWRGRSSNIAGVVSTLSDVLMYNGRFVVICNTIHLTLTLISIVTPLQQSSLVTSLTDPITAILIMRFLLALQDANQAALDKSTLGGADSRTAGDPPADRDTLQFASVVIGSIGEAFDGAFADHRYDEDDGLDGPSGDEETGKDMSSLGNGEATDSAGACGLDVEPDSGGELGVPGSSKHM
ncbi:hypothetical protein BC628DRAFT_1446651 [Trametes gibbosa]|nr:hypothetical protein BC628DRAFT_1446651 [Trametes gibbosa]